MPKPYYSVGLTDTGDRGGGTWTSGGGSTTPAVGIGILEIILFAAAELISSLQTQPKVETQEKDKDSRIYTVYGLFDGETLVYVGRTKNVYARRNAHSNSVNRSHLSFEIIRDQLTWIEARGLEQLLMMGCHTINTANKAANQINGIKFANSNRAEYIKAGWCLLEGSLEYLKNIISNEYYNWIGE